MLAKAKITNLVTGEEVICMFNPKEYTFSKQNKWEEKTAKGKSVPHLEFGGGAPANLKLQLLFDTCEAHEYPGLRVSAGDDVRTYTKGLWDMMKISEQNVNPATKKGEPPHVRFEWGSLWSFEAVIDSISQKFTLFKADGTPLRATLDVSFRQVKDEGQYPRQNPTSGGSPNERLRTVRAGDHLPGIAFEEYGDAAMWRYLADCNPEVTDPLDLRPGQVLIVRPL
ncbi:MAG TPA: peptidoglycan-binding protein [Roseiflexaceae bacterium]|nr:peptidoglycan-binding protein [Roseiflexaceae bacterium]